VLALSWIASEPALDYLSTTLSDAPPPLAIEIINHLGQIERSQAYASQLLVDFCRSRNLTEYPDRIKQAIASALGNLGNPIAVPCLVQLLGETDDRIKFQAIASLQKISSSIPPEILQIADREQIDPELRSGIKLCLANWRSN
jgi:HEAT repeat protein